MTILVYDTLPTVTTSTYSTSASGSSPSFSSSPIASPVTTSAQVSGNPYSIPPVTQIPNVPIQPPNFTSLIQPLPLGESLNLIKYITGSKWIVNYYQQILTSNMAPQPLDTQNPVLYQQYDIINNLELRVQQGLSSSQNAQTSAITIQGTSIIYPPLIPNLGDIFVADIGDGNLGLFTITNTNRLTYRLQSAFEIEYILLGYVSSNSTLFTNLQNKVVNTYYYDRGSLEHGQNPLILSQDYGNVVNFQAAYRELIDYYFDTFFNQEYSTFLLPGQPTYRVYDAFIVDAIMNIMNTFDHRYVRDVKQFNVSSDPIMNQPQFWKGIKDVSYNPIKYGNSVMALAVTTDFQNNVFMRTIAYSFIDYIVYPSTVDLTVNPLMLPDVKAVAQNILMPTTIVNQSTLSNTTSATYILASGVVPIIYPVINNGMYYVLSNNFYNQSSTNTMSILEILTWNYMNRKTLDPAMINALLDNYQGWERLEQFYYIPIMLYLIYYYLGGVI